MKSFQQVNERPAKRGFRRIGLLAVLISLPLCFFACSKIGRFCATPHQGGGAGSPSQAAVNWFPPCADDDLKVYRTRSLYCGGWREEGKLPTGELLSRIHDKDRHRAQMAIDALGIKKDPAAVKPLIEMIREQGADNYMKYYPVDALSLIKTPEVKEFFLKALNDPAIDGEIRAHIARRIAMMNDDEFCRSRKVHDALFKELQNSNFIIRSYYMDALAKLGCKRVIPTLIRSLHDPKVMIRTAACQGLGRFGYGNVAEPLRAALSDDVPEMRAEAIRSLESLGDRRAIPDIERLFADKDYWVQEQARRSLKVLNRKK